jgi:hypothetical protein
MPPQEVEWAVPTTIPTAPNEEPVETVTRLGRISRPPRSLTQDMMVYESIQDIMQVDPEIDWMSPLAYAASADPDVMYLHEALIQPDKTQFLKAMMEEVEGQTRNKNLVLIKRSKLPKWARIFHVFGQ